jgi:predicted dehydrogenase
MGHIGVGVIGVGVFGENHCRTYADDPGAELKAICDVNEPRLAEMGEAFGVRDRYTDYHDLLARDDIDAVSIVTPDFLHPEFTIAAAEAGKHILLEKPMATTMEDCAAISDAVSAAGVTLLVDFHNRFNPPMVRVKEAIDGDELGPVQSMYVRLSDSRWVPTGMLTWGGESTVAWFLACHCVDLLQWLSGAKVERVYTVSRSRVLKEEEGLDTPDFFFSTLEFSDGSVAVVENNWILSESMLSVAHFLLEVVGSKGHMEADVLQSGTIRKFTADGAVSPDIHCAPEIHGRPMGFAIESIRHFIRVLEGAEPILPGPAEAAQVTAVVAAIHESAEAGGKPITLA